MARIPTVSRDFLYIDGIKAFDTNSPDAAADPTTLAAAVAFTTDEPADADFHPASWVNAQTLRILVGPGALELAAGVYQVWLRVTGGTEQPNRPVGKLVVT